eukprot:gene16045-679_t
MKCPLSKEEIAKIEEGLRLFPNLQEFRKAIHKKRNKAPGESGISFGHLSSLQDETLQRLLVLMENAVLVHQKQLAEINNRSIIEEIMSKAVAGFLLAPLKKMWRGTFMPTEQGASQKGRGTVKTAIAAMSALLITKNGQILIIDMKGAFDNVDWDILWEVLRDFGLPDWWILAWKHAWSTTYYAWRTRWGTSQGVKVKVGGKQGSLEMPYLFQFYMEHIRYHIKVVATEEGFRVDIFISKSLGNIGTLRVRTKPQKDPPDKDLKILNLTMNGVADIAKILEAQGYPCPNIITEASELSRHPYVNHIATVLADLDVTIISPCGGCTEEGPILFPSNSEDELTIHTIETPMGDVPGFVGDGRVMEALQEKGFHHLSSAIKAMDMKTEEFKGIHTLVPELNIELEWTDDMQAYLEEHKHFTIRRKPPSLPHCIKKLTDKEEDNRKEVSFEINQKENQRQSTNTLWAEHFLMALKECGVTEPYPSAEETGAAIWSPISQNTDPPTPQEGILWVVLHRYEWEKYEVARNMQCLIITTWGNVRRGPVRKDEWDTNPNSTVVVAVSPAAQEKLSQTMFMFAQEPGRRWCIEYTGYRPVIHQYLFIELWESGQETPTNELMIKETGANAAVHIMESGSQSYTIKGTSQQAEYVAMIIAIRSVKDNTVIKTDSQNAIWALLEHMDDTRKNKGPSSSPLTPEQNGLIQALHDCDHKVVIIKVSSHCLDPQLLEADKAAGEQSGLTTCRGDFALREAGFYCGTTNQSTYGSSLRQVKSVLRLNEGEKYLNHIWNEHRRINTGKTW